LVAYKTSITGDLVEAKNSSGIFAYEYDQQHNLTRITYPDGTWKELGYNVQRGWVISFRNRVGCVENYKYEVSQTDPKGHFWSTVEKICNGKITNNSRYEFIHKLSRDGSFYLQTVIVTNNEKHTRVDFDERNRNIRREEEGVVRQYRYDPVGYHIEAGKNDLVEFRKYESSCELPSLRRTGILNSNGDPAKYVWTFVQYELPFCRPSRLYSSDGRKLKLSYESNGRANIVDDLGGTIRIEYEVNLRQPKKATIDGLGEINMTWDAKGEVTLEPTDVSQRILPYINLLRDLLPDRDFGF
jgi:YD repeat-containing protein